VVKVNSVRLSVVLYLDFVCNSSEHMIPNGMGVRCGD
jgi:hypothetical protein